MKAKRSIKERQSAISEATRQEADWDRLQEVLDQELRRLPDIYRAAIVLCDLEGKSIGEAARQLGCPTGTVGTRLARGRKLLAGRLARQGLILSGAAIAATLNQNVVVAAIPITAAVASINTAALLAATPTASGLISAKAVALAQAVIKSMLLS